MIRDNRLEAFNQAIGFEKDEESGLWVPMGTVVRGSAYEPSARLNAFNATFTAHSSPKPEQGRTHFDAMEYLMQPPPMSVYRGYHGCVSDGTTETDLCDEVEAWLEAMQEED